MVVGGGWGGFGAAYALLKAGVKVTILDASETSGGLSAGWRTPGGRSVEAGIKGYITAVPAFTALACSTCMGWTLPLALHCVYAADFGTNTAISMLWWVSLALTIPSQTGLAAASGLLMACR